MSGSRTSESSRSVIERFGLRSFSQLDDPLEREKKYRENLRRFLISTLIFLTSTIFLSVIPLYPIPVILLFAIVSSSVAFRSPVSGFTILVLVSTPAYAYQAGVPFWWLILYLLVMTGFGIRALNESSNIVSPLIGILASTLILTPLFFLVIPLMLAVALLEDRGGVLDHLGMLLTFLIIFIPFTGVAFSQSIAITLGDQISSMRPQEVYDVMKSELLPLFTRISYTPNPPLRSLDIPALQMTISSAFETSTTFHPYIFLIIDRLIIIYIPILLAITLSFIAVINRLWPWLIDVGIDLTKMMKYSYVYTLVGGTLFFIVALEALSDALGYFTSINPVAMNGSVAISGGFALFTILGSSVAMGFVMLSSSTRLAKRDEIAVLSANLLSKSKKMAEDISNFFSTLKSIEKTCAGIDVSIENSVASKHQEEVRVTLAGADTMPYNIIRERITRIEEVQDEHSRTVSSTYHGLYQYHVDRVSKYNEYMRSLSNLGIDGLDPIPSLTVEQLSAEGANDSVQRQDELNRKLATVAQRTMDLSESLILAIRRGFDPSLVEPTSTAITRNFIGSGEGERALDSLITTLSFLSTRYLTNIQQVASSLQMHIRTTLEIYESHLLPLIESLGRDVSESQTGQIALQLTTHEKDLSRPKGIVFLSDVMSKLEFLESGTRTVLSELLILLKDFEKMNDSRVPNGFHWGKDTQLVGQIDSSLRFLKTKDTGDRLSNIEYVIKTIEGAAATLKEYMTMNEFILNYPNMETLMLSKLDKVGYVTSKELPVKAKYSSQYLKFFAIGRYSDVIFDSKNTKLQRRDSKNTKLQRRKK